jgi:hypothetical protein
MFAHLDPVMDIALALSALLAISVEQDPPWECPDPLTTGRNWLPWVLLVGLAIASGVFGIMHPQEFAAAAGEPFLDPGSVAAASNHF